MSMLKGYEKIIRKMLCFILTVGIIFGGIPLTTVLADDNSVVLGGVDTENQNYYPEVIPENLSYFYGYDYLGTLENGANLQKAYRRISDAAWEFYNSDEDLEVGYNNLGGFTFYMINSIDISDLNISFEQYDVLEACFEEDNPIFYFLNDAFGIRMSIDEESGGKIKKLSISCATFFDDTGKDLLEYTIGKRRQYYSSLITKKLHEYYDLTRNLETDLEKEKVIHDKIVNEVDYNHENLFIATGHNIIGTFTETLTVCEGYSRTMQLVCNYCGIDCITVEGLACNDAHRWNMVKLEGEWYNLDVTNDDMERHSDLNEGIWGSTRMPEIESDATYAFFNIPDRFFSRIFTPYSIEEAYIPYPDASDSDTMMNAFKIADKQNTVTIDECKDYIKSRILKGETLFYTYRNVDNPGLDIQISLYAAEAAFAEIEEETGDRYDFNTRFSWSSQGWYIIDNDMDSMLWFTPIAVSKVNEYDDFTSYIYNVPYGGASVKWKHGSPDDMYKRIVIPDMVDGYSVTEVDVDDGGRLNQYVFPDTVRIISYSGAGQIIVPEGAKEIDYAVYSERGLNAVYIPDSAQSIATGTNCIIFGYSGSAAEEYCSDPKKLDKFN